MKKREKVQYALAALLALAGIVFITVRFWGMRFSGFLLLGAAAVLVIDVLLTQKARDGKKSWRRLKGLFTFGMTLLVVNLISIEMFVIDNGNDPYKAFPAKAVVVLGAGVNGTEPSLSLRTRLDATLAYLEDHPDIPVVVSGGQGYGEEITEARCMADYLTAHGVEEGRLILEEQASNTAENLAFSRELLLEAGVDPAEDIVAVVTNDFHIARTKLIGERQDYDLMIGVPAKLPWKHLEINYYLREAFAVVKTVLFD